MIQIKTYNEGTHLLVRPINYSTSDTTCNTYYEIIKKSEEWKTDINEEGIEAVNLITKNESIIKSGNVQLLEIDLPNGLIPIDIENAVIAKLGIERLYSNK